MGEAWGYCHTYVVPHLENPVGRMVQFLEELYFENFKASREKEQRAAKEAAAKARQVRSVGLGLGHFSSALYQHCISLQVRGPCHCFSYRAMLAMNRWCRVCSKTR